MALFGNDMFGHHMLSNVHGQNQGFGKGGSNSFGSGSSSFGKGQTHHGGQDPNTMGQLGNHAIFGRQKSLLNDMTSSKHDKSKPYVFSSYSYPYDFHHEGMASMFEKPLEKVKKKPVLTKQQSYSPGDKPELRRAPTFSSNPKLMRSKTINPSETAPSRPPRLSRSLSIADDQVSPMNMDLAIPDFQKRNSEKGRRFSTPDALSKPKKKTWPDIVRRISRKKRSSKEKKKKSEGSTDDSARESLGSTSSVGTTESPVSSYDLQSEEIPRCNTLDSKLSRGSVKSRSSTSSDYDREQERLILSLLNNDMPPDDSVFDDKHSSTQSDQVEHGDDSTDPETLVTPRFDPLQRVDDESDPDEQQKNYSESPTLVLRRIKHLHPPEVDNASEKSGHSGRVTPRSYFSDNSDHSSYRHAKDKGSKRKPKDNENMNGKVPTYYDPSDSETSEAYFDYPKQDTGMQVKSNALSNKPKRLSDKKRKEPVMSANQDKEISTQPNVSQKPSVHDIIKNFQNLKTTPKNEDSEKPKTIEAYKPEFTRKPYAEPKVFTISQPSTSRPFSSIYSKPISPGYSSKEQPKENEVIIQHVQPYSINNPLEQVNPKYRTSPKPDLEVKDTIGNDNLTADSSESGYGTSHIANSPKGYDNMKVLNFVNSLPNHSDMEEQNSETSREEILKNGSETESNDEDESDRCEPHSDLSNVKCVSGSDTDVASINSDISDSQLEVTKLLESPTDVCERVTSDMSRESNQSSPGVTYRKMSDPNIKKPIPAGDTLFSYENISQRNGHDNTDSFNKKRDPSETEVLKVFESPKKEELQKLPEFPVETEVEVVISQPQSMAPTTESKLYRAPDHSEYSGTFGKSSRPLSYTSSRQYSTIQESNLTQCIDAVLHLLNCLLVLCSSGVIGTGIWLLLKEFNVNHVTIILGDNLLQVIVYVSIAGAGIALLAALCLCCGVKKDKYGLSFFAIVLIIVIIAFSSAAILSAIFADKLHGIEFRVNFKERLISKYGNITDTNRENEYFTTSWDSMQKLFECCGAEGEVSDMSSWAVFKKYSIWYRLQPFKATIYVPESCCKKNMNLEVCQGSDHNLLGPPVYGPPMDEIYSQQNPNLNTTGCYDFFASYLAKVATLVAIVMGGLAGLYFITVMLTWVFCFKKNQDYEDYLYGSFYEMGQDDQDNYHSGLNDIETQILNENEHGKLEYGHENGRLVLDDDYKLTNSTKEPEYFNQTKSPPIEETSFIQRNNEIMHEIPIKKSVGAEKGHMIPVSREQELRTTQSFIPATPEQQVRTTKSYIPEELQDSEESDSDTESENSDGRNTTFRRNLWLSSESGRAVNLLSIAIEEEDSNFEDSDLDSFKGQNSGTFTGN